MPEIAWQQHSNVYTASISNLRGVITEQHTTDTFAARIETFDGEVLQAWEPLPDFETAAWWVLATIVDVEQILNKHSPYQKIFETLDLCKSKLSLVEDSIHIQRLENIRNWIVTRNTQEQELVDEWRQRTNEPKKLTVLDWQALNTTDWYIDTRHGRATIRELRPDKSPFRYASTSVHEAWIEHPSGAICEWNTSSIDFMAADAWVQQTLDELDDPRVVECFLGNITFTLNICRRLLANEPDPMHIARMEYIKDMLETVLP